MGDDEWSEASRLEGLFDSQSGVTAPESGVFWLAYDDEYVYFAARLADSEPKRISAEEYRTNTGLGGDDNVALQLDVVGNLADANEFEINPRGATSISLAGGRAFKREWSGEFLAKGRVTAQGWEAEARIPWRVLPVPGAGVRDMRFNIERFMSRGLRSSQHVYTGSGRIQQSPIWKGVEVPDLPNSRPLRLLPYGYVGYDKDDKEIVNAGLDLKTSLTEQIEFVGSINPDFRNIENQILGLEFSRFERLADESRPFFLEGSDFVGTALFASQRIRSFDVGLNTYGRLGRATTFGLVSTHDFGEESTVALGGTHTFDPTQYLRFGMTTLRRPSLTNDAALLRYQKRLGAYAVSVRNMTSWDSAEGVGHNSSAVLEYANKGLSADVVYEVVEEDFRPRLGFFRERDYRGFSGEIEYSENLRGGYLNDFGGGVFFTDRDRLNGDFYRNELGVFAFTTNRYGLALSTFASWERFEDSRDRSFSASLGYPRGNRYKGLSVSYTGGSIAGKDFRQTSVSARHRFFQRLSISLSHETFDHFEHEEQSIGSLSYDFDADRTVSCRVVRRDGHVNPYLAYRKAGNRGVEFFVIVGDPNAERFRNSLILKMVVPVEVP